jgi:hypothetical protein
LLALLGLLGAGAGVLALGRSRLPDQHPNIAVPADLVQEFFPSGDLRTHLEFCLSSYGGTPAREPTFEATIAGKIIAMGRAENVPALPVEAFPCHAQMEWYVDISDGGWDVSRVRWTTSSRIRAMLPLPKGDPINVRMRVDASGLGKQGDLVLRDASGPLLVIHSGRLMTSAADARTVPLLHELEVNVADVTAVNTTDSCGEALMYALVVVGTERWRILPDARELVGVGELPFWFWNANSHAWRNGSCTDMEDVSAWLLWRAR